MHRQGGHALLVAAMIVLAAAASAMALATGATAVAAQRERATARALAQAREALLSHASDRPIDAVVGPGYLPCPDRDDDGWAEPTCGSLNGHLGQEERLGRLPWKTLGLPDLRDGHGERLWYAVSTRHKGLLNCAASAGCVDMGPGAALGTITVRDAAGNVVHDGRLADGRRGGAAAVVIAPGPPLARGGHAQRRECAAPECDPLSRCVAEPPWLAPRCDPRNYLDLAPDPRFAFEDNADFHDRSDAAARPGNGNGFIHGPVRLADGAEAVNDRLAVVAWSDLMPRVMARVALEAAHCLRAAAPAPQPACGTQAHPGRIGDPDLASAPADCAARPGPVAWWNAWREHVLYARAAAAGLEVASPAGRVILAGRRFAVLVTEHAGDCGTGRASCGADGCTQVIRAERSAGRAEALVSVP